MSKNRKIGDKGEEIAVNFLQQNGYEIVERNWKHKHKEIDIIAKQNNVFIFVEVKARNNLKMGFPEDFVTERKANNITSASQFYLEDKKYQDIRFDVISIVFSNEEEHELLHIKDAFY